METPYFHWRPHIFIRDLKALIRELKLFIGDLVRVWDRHTREKRVVSAEKLGFPNEKLGLTKEKLMDDNENLEVFDEHHRILGFSDEKEGL